jgi:hypothetical protein
VCGRHIVKIAYNNLFNFFSTATILQLGLNGLQQANAAQFRHYCGCLGGFFEFKPFQLNAITAQSGQGWGGLQESFKELRGGTAWPVMAAKTPETQQA